MGPFGFVDAEKACYPVSLPCCVLKVSRSGYYAWKGRPPSGRAKAEAALAAEGFGGQVREEAGGSAVDGGHHLRSHPGLADCTWPSSSTSAAARTVAGWSMSGHLRADLVVEALNMALWRCTPSAGLVHHSDRGDQYTPVEFGKRLKEAGLLASMGSVGDALML